jgi:hypothetical protein
MNRVPVAAPPPPGRLGTPEENGEVCGTCRFSRERGLHNPRPGRTGKLTTCHRLPATPDARPWGGAVHGGWPVVNPWDWCGLYESRVQVRRGEETRKQRQRQEEEGSERDQR